MDIKQSTRYLIIIVVIILLVGWYTYHVIQSNRSPGDDSAVVQSLAANTEEQFTNLAGETVGLDGYLGQIIVVNSWASWSPQSGQQLEQLSDLADQYQDRGVVFLAINRSEPPTTAEAYLSTVTLSPELQIILDDKDNFYERIEAYAMPVTIIFDANGDVVFEEAGALVNEEAQAVIDGLLSL